MNTQNSDPPPKFGWFGLRAKLRTLKQMYRYHSPRDVEQDLRHMLWKGMQIGRKQVTPTEPYCDIHCDPEFDRPLFCIAPGIFVCEQCRSFTSQPLPIARPTIKLDMPPDAERHTGPIYRVGERPVFANARKWHPDDEAGPATQHTRAIRVKGTP